MKKVFVFATVAMFSFAVMAGTPEKTDKKTTDKKATTECAHAKADKSDAKSGCCTKKAEGKSCAKAEKKSCCAEKKKAEAKK